MSDKIIKCLAYNGRISITCIDSTKLVEEARRIHDMSPTAIAAFGRMLTMTALMANEMKNETDKITVQIKGNGPIGTMLAVAKNKPIVKGYVHNPQADLPLNDIGKLDVSGVVGTEGYINVIKDIGLKDPYIGISTLSSGEIAEDFAQYFSISEQTQSAVALGVLVNKNGVKSSGGYIINPMPDATEEDISSVEKAIFAAGAISKMLDNDLELEEIARKVTGDENLILLSINEEVSYECDCNKEKFERNLISLGKKELEEIKESNEDTEIVCQFCNKKYTFLSEEIEKLIQEI